MTAAHLTDAALSDLLDGIGDEVAVWERHVAACDYCRGRLDGMRGAIEYARAAIRRLGETDVPEELWPLVAAQTIYAGTIGRRWWRRRVRLAWALVIVVLLGLAIFHAAYPRAFRDVRDSLRGIFWPRGQQGRTR